MELLKISGKCQSPGRQSGMALLVTLIILILITLATVAIVRSMDTSNVISGNFAFKETARSVSDRAITDAINNLPSLISGGSGNNDQVNRYFSMRQTSLDSLGMPTAINWTNVPCRDESNLSCTTASKDKYKVRYFIERQCDSNPVLTDTDDIKGNCDYEIRSNTPSEVLAIRYRILIRVEGPRNTIGNYEVMVSGPAA